VDRRWDLAVGSWSIIWNLGARWEELFLDSYGVARDSGRISFYRLLYDLVADRELVAMRAGRPDGNAPGLAPSALWLVSSARFTEFGTRRSTWRYRDWSLLLVALVSFEH